MLKRVLRNPIIKANKNNAWESQYVLNTAALYFDGIVHFLYRAIGDSGLSVLGYAASNDGIQIDKRLNKPVYICNGAVPSHDTIHYPYSSGGSFSGCEDPRLTKIDDRIYMTYTAFNANKYPPGVAFTSITLKDFLNEQWIWRKPIRLSRAGEMHKNWVIFPEKINGKFAILHSISPSILINYFESLDLNYDVHIKSHYQASGRIDYWDFWVRGVGPPPIKTEEGWLVLYHAMDKEDPDKYKLGAMILDEKDPTKILYRSRKPLLEPKARYENQGYKPGVIYCCGAVVIDKKLYVYYGAADTAICAAITELESLLSYIKNPKKELLKHELSSSNF